MHTHLVSFRSYLHLNPAVPYRNFVPAGLVYFVSFSNNAFRTDGSIFLQVSACAFIEFTYLISAGPSWYEMIHGGTLQFRISLL